MNSAIIFLSQMNLFRWLTFLLGSLTATPIALLSWINSFFLTIVFVLKQLSLPWEILIMLSQFLSTFLLTQKQMPLFIKQLLTIHLRDVLWEDIFKLCASVTAAKFAKGFLEWPNLLMVIKQESINSQKLGSPNFLQNHNSVLSISKSAVPPLSDSPEVSSSAFTKVKLFAKDFSHNYNLDNLGISLLVFPSRTTLKQHRISVTFTLVKKVITKHDTPKTPGPDFILVVILKSCQP